MNLFFSRRGWCFLPPTARTKDYLTNLADAGFHLRNIHNYCTFYMQKKCSWLIYSSFMILGMIGCSDDTRNKNLDSWLGNYNYSEPPVKSFGGYSMVMTWDLSVNKIDNMYKSILNVTGQQTAFSLLNNLTGSDTTLFVIYDKSLSGVNQEFHKGDTLFILSKAATRIKTKWNSLKPILSEFVPKECNCFVFTGTNENNNTLRISQ